MMPATWIGEFKVQAMPASLALSPYYICANRSDDRNYDLGTESPNRSGKLIFSCVTRGTARTRAHLVYRLTAKIHEITSERTKGVQKFLVLQEGKSGKECAPDSAVEARVLLIEESPGSRRRFAHEKYSYTIRTIAPPKALSGIRILSSGLNGLLDSSCFADGTLIMIWIYTAPERIS
jgi:hypothetical protein